MAKTKKNNNQKTESTKLGILIVMLGALGYFGYDVVFPADPYANAPTVSPVSVAQAEVVNDSSVNIDSTKQGTVTHSREGNVVTVTTTLNPPQVTTVSSKPKLSEADREILELHAEHEKLLLQLNNAKLTTQLQDLGVLAIDEMSVPVHNTLIPAVLGGNNTAAPAPKLEVIVQDELVENISANEEDYVKKIDPDEIFGHIRISSITKTKKGLTIYLSIGGQTTKAEIGANYGDVIIERFTDTGLVLQSLSSGIRRTLGKPAITLRERTPSIINDPYDPTTVQSIVLNN